MKKLIESTFGAGTGILTADDVSSRVALTAGGAGTRTALHLRPHARRGLGAARKTAGAGLGADELEGTAASVRAVALDLTAVLIGARDRAAVACVGAEALDHAVVARRADG